MNDVLRLFLRPASGALLVALASSVSSSAQALAPSVASKTARVDGLEIHYLAGGKGGDAVLLFHGYAETSRMWRPLIPRLAERFTVVAPDLPGIGDSAVPQQGLDLMTAAGRMHALAASLGIRKARVVGHDIGLMVAYAYAALYPAEVEKLVVMDAFLPGVEGAEPIYDNPHMWHFRFHGATPEALVKGRERTYFEYYWNEFAADGMRSLPNADREAYTAAYSRPGRMRAAWAYFASFPDTGKEFVRLAQTKLPMPVLSIGGEKSLGDALGRQMKAVANDVTVVVLKDTGHWLMEERPKETMDALVAFL